MLEFIGPDLSEGCLPALFYFALSAHESLYVDPYNQPATYLSGLPIRIFSIDLPGHGKELSSHEALEKWAHAYQNGASLISATADQAAALIADLITKGIVEQHKCAVMGLSRGGLIAAHVAARCPNVPWVLAFAPLTKVSNAKEFHHLKDDERVIAEDMSHLVPQLLEKKVRFYIGNCDVRVSTRSCFDFVEKLSFAMHAAGKRSPSAELIISPSIGFQGHGTPKHIFHAGAQWLAEQMGVIDVR